MGLANGGVEAVKSETVLGPIVHPVARFRYDVKVSTTHGPANAVEASIRSVPTARMSFFISLLHNKN
jgi:hypothetical protein